MTYLLSDTETSQTWLNQFETTKDRSNARQLLNSLKYVSNRDFENYIHISLGHLQSSLNSRLAVYPVIAPTSPEIIGQNLFKGNIISPEIIKSREKGRRKKYGSEDRVGHILERVSNAHKGNGSVSKIECCPTLNTVIKQGIKDIVFVDDICGSGERFVNFYKKEVPLYLKRLISIKKIRLWFICYAVTSSGIKFIHRKIRYFEKNPSNIIVHFPYLKFDKLLSDEIRELCFRYSRNIYGNESASLGYKNSIGGIVFEHGCPNNLPRILWENNKKWNAIFINRSIPLELKPSFSEENLIDNSEVLWSVNQKNLAIKILDSIDNNNLDPKYNLIITLLGLVSRGINSRENLASRAFISLPKIESFINELTTSNLLKEEERNNLKITTLGKAILNKFKKTKLKKINITQPLELLSENYYPYQCDGHFQFLVDC